VISINNNLLLLFGGGAIAHVLLGIALIECGVAQVEEHI